MGACSAFLKRKKYCPLGKAVWSGRIGSHGPGAVLFPAHRHHSGHAGQAARHCLPGDGGGYASAMSGSAMAVAIGYALQAAPGAVFPGHGGLCRQRPGQRHPVRRQGAGGPLAVLFIAVIAAELGKAVSKETKIDILVTPLVTILAGVGLSALLAPAIGTAASAVGTLSSGPPCSSPSGWGFWCRWSSAWPLLCPSRRPPSAPPSA